MMTTVHNVTSLAPFEIWEVMFDNRTIKFHQPLILTPIWMSDDPDKSDESEYMEVEFPELAISSYGANIEELESAVRSDIRVAWKLYVLADDSQLTPDAVAVKNNYLAISGLVDE
jgi:hypothetical protein